MTDFKIYSHLLCGFQGRVLDEEEEKRAKVLAVLFLLSDSIMFFNLLKKLTVINQIPNVDKRLYSLAKHCDLLFHFTKDYTCENNPGIINKLFFYTEMLAKLENFHEAEMVRKKLFEKIKEKFNQLKLDFFVMEKRLDPYDKIQPSFDPLPLTDFLEGCWKKLIKDVFIFVKKHIKTESISIFLLKEEKSLTQIFGKKKMYDLLSMIDNR